MKSLYLVLITIIGFAFNARAQSPFTKETHQYKIDTILRVTVLYKDKFYCLKADHEIFVLNIKTNLVDSSYKDDSQQLKLENLYVHKDTLFGQSRFDNYFLSNNGWTLLPKKSLRPNYIYEDDRFVVTSTCSGEWGGSLYFKDKATNQQYECACTCVIDVHKENKIYTVTASLSHMSGFANIFEIDDPLKLKMYDRSYLKGKKIIYKGEGESKSTQGTKQLIDSVGITIAANLNYNSKNYYLTEKFKKVSIDTVSNKKLVPVEDLTNMGIYSYGSSENRISYDHQVATFGNDNETGFIDIHGGDNKLVFYIFDIKHN